MEWCASIPKIELHAHLNGSVRDSTLLELATELGITDMEDVIMKSDRALSEVFKLFDLIHVVTTDHKGVTRITKEVIEDFAADNVKYLELRTTPKRNVDKGMTKRSYMEAVLEGIRSVKAVMLDLCNKSSVDVAFDGSVTNKIYVGLILSIDRRETAEAAMETVDLAIEMRDLGVVGIDLSGNPRIGEWSTFLPALEYAKQQGLSITLHCGG